MKSEKKMQILRFYLVGKILPHDNIVIFVFHHDTKTWKLLLAICNDVHLNFSAHENKPVVYFL